MALLELVVTGQESIQRWRRHIPENKVIRVGRAPQDGWEIPWDRCISREHADIELQGDGIQVRCLEKARNPILYQDQLERACYIRPGEEFYIGDTKFQLNAIDFSPMEVVSMDEASFHSDDLKDCAFDNADQRLEVLSNLPEVIAQATTDTEFARHLVKMALAGIPHADVAAVVHYDMGAHRDTSAPLMMQFDSQKDYTGRFKPSRRLIMSALDDQQTKLHVWMDGEESSGQSFTISANLDWAFCTPINEEACQGWCFYLSGKISSNIKGADDLKGDVRFIELLAQVTGAIRRVRMLERRQSELHQFFSPAVAETITKTSTETAGDILAPRVLDATVLFCDMRGFSRRAEKLAHDLPALLERCKQALGVMTKGIFKFEGVVADFQGDAALGFWGWPIPPGDGPFPACRAALKIFSDFAHAQSDPSHPLADFHVGIGIAHGQAIAGKIGTEEQAKIGVFGPVVNLGARLEGMTKYLRVPVLIDEYTAELVRKNFPPEAGRCRRLGRVVPYGMETPLTVSQLLPSEKYYPMVSDQDIVNYEKALDAMIEGNWGDAMDLLDCLPVEDRAKDFLLQEMALHGYEPPKDWDGIIRMSSK